MWAVDKNIHPILFLESKDMEFSPTFVTTLVAALATHVWFKRFDPIPLLNSVAVLAAVPTALICYFSSSSLQLSSFYDFRWVYFLFYSGLVLSVCSYRLSPFHPMAKYPGPIILKVSKLYTVWIAYRGKYHLYVKSLHDIYGPTIRTGPNELSTIEKDLIPYILGNQGMPKGPIWDGRRFAQGGNSEYDSLIDVRDNLIHARLRKPWNKALGSEPLKDYEGLLIGRVSELRDLLKAQCFEGKDQVGRVDIAQWLSYFSYDFMGDLAFAGSFNYMKEGGKDGGMAAMTSAMYFISITQHAPWISKLIRATPILNRGMKNFIAYGVTHGITRVGAQIKRKDLFYHMTEAADVTGPESIPFIISNVLLAIVAGSDTTSSVLSNTAYLLMSHPKVYAELQHELDDAFKENHILEFDPSRMYDDVLSKLSYLNAVINEALRLFPAVPTTLQRAPVKGSQMKVLQAEDGTSMLLPEGNAIMVPPYTIHRDPRYFSPSPDKFIPERWLPSTPGKTEYITTRDAFIPFSAGPANCAGRTLALMELRYAITTLVRHFEVEFDSSLFDPSSWEDSLEDRFTFGKGGLPTRIKWRG